MIFFSADGNFEVTLATKATLFHNGLVEVRYNAEINTNTKEILKCKYTENKRDLSLDRNS